MVCRKAELEVFFRINHAKEDKREFKNKPALKSIESHNAKEEKILKKSNIEKCVF